MKHAQDPAVDAYLDRATAWRGEMRKLRAILLECGLEEGLKWGKPCFQLEGKNVAILQPFRKHCALMFFRGALLEDTHGLLRSQGPNSRSAMRLEFTDEAGIRKTVVRSYVKQAMAVERAGLRVDLEATREPELPEELTRALRKDRALAKAFASLTPGRRRAYVLHFTGAKQSRTRVARIERCTPKILAGVGPNGR